MVVSLRVGAGVAAWCNEVCPPSRIEFIIIVLLAETASLHEQASRKGQLPFVRLPRNTAQYSRIPVVEPMKRVSGRTSSHLFLPADEVNLISMRDANTRIFRRIIENPLRDHKM